MHLRIRTRLGLAICERRLLIAELRFNGRTRVRHVDAIELDSPAAWDDIDALGKTLRQHLKTNNIAAKSVVIGLPAKWVMTRRRPVPPADADATRQMLRLTASHAFTFDADQLVIDYMPPAEGSAEPAAMLAAATLRNIDHVRKLAEAAGLQIDAIVCSAAALAAHVAGEGAAALLRLDDTAAELAVWRDGQLQMLHHMSRPRDLPSLQRDLKHLLAADPQLAVAIEGAPLYVASWDNHFDDLRGPLHQATGAEIRPLALADVQWPDASAADTDPTRYLPAVAAGMAAAEPVMRSIDFAHSRLAEPKRASVFVRWRLAIAAAAVVLLAVGALALSIQRQRNELADLTAQLNAMKDQAKDARAMIDKVRLAEGWFRDRPRVMEMLRQLTLAFPERGTVWLTELAIREDDTATLGGSAEDDRSVLGLIGELHKMPGISQVKLLNVRQAGTTHKETHFSIAIRFDHPSQIEPNNNDATSVAQTADKNS